MKSTNSKGSADGCQDFLDSHGRKYCYIFFKKKIYYVYKYPKNFTNHKILKEIIWSTFMTQQAYTNF